MSETDGHLVQQAQRMKAVRRYRAIPGNPPQRSGRCHRAEIQQAKPQLPENDGIAGDRRDRPHGEIDQRIEENATRRSKARSRTRPRTCSIRSGGREEESPRTSAGGLLRTQEGYVLLHPVAPGVLLLLERGTVGRSVLHQILGSGLLRALQLSLFLLFLLALLGEFLLPLFEPVIALWQEYSE